MLHVIHFLWRDMLPLCCPGKAGGIIHKSAEVNCPRGRVPSRVDTEHVNDDSSRDITPAEHSGGAANDAPNVRKTRNN